MPNRPVQSNAAAEERRGERGRGGGRRGEANVKRSPERKGLEGKRVEEGSEGESGGEGFEGGGGGGGSEAPVTLQQPSGHTLHVKHNCTEAPWESAEERKEERRARMKEERVTQRAPDYREDTEVMG
ncbi:hypothetical protein Q5P01_010251 [Channa striata]|uniref:Uncharacterized protein n=1 Tax=Channa striata TaxID=64152 RepID=A0AA88MZE9_CHASR|nr:hypothetical protein Q5P01_010251 [Channa striata]